MASKLSGKKLQVQSMSTSKVAHAATDGARRTHVAAIIKVSEDDYVPAGVALRARISPCLFTADLDETTIEALEADPLVKSVEFSRRLSTSADR